MRLLIIYDISDDRVRTRVADACLDYGLERIQYSAFAGALKRAHQRELELKVRRLLGRAPAKVRFIPLDERLWAQQQVIERRASAPPQEARRDNEQQTGGDGQHERREVGDTRMNRPASEVFGQTGDEDDEDESEHDDG